MAFGTLLSRVLGLIRDILIAAIFPRYVTDAWTVAFRLPNLFRRLLGEGSLSVSFIPVFVKILNKNDGDQGEAKKLVSSVFTLLLLILTALTFVFVVWMDPIMRVMVGGAGYSSIAGKTEITIKMAQIMFPFIFLMSLYAFFMAILNSFKKFALGALAPCLLNLTLIIAALIPWGNLEEQAYFQSWAVIFGGFLQMGLLIPQIISLGFFPRISFDFNTPALRQIYLAMGPSTLGMGIVQITGAINVYFASHLPQGAHSYIYLADRVLELPLSLFAVSLGSALLPMLSQYWANGQKEKMLAVASENLRLIFYVSIPCSFAFWFFSQPIVEVLFMRGKFIAADVQQTTSVLKIYSLTVLTASAVRILAPCFYAISNTWVPAMSSAIALVFHVIIAPGMIEKYGLAGLPGSSVASATLNMVLLFFAHQYIIGSLQVTKLVSSLSKFTFASVVMAFFLEYAKPLYFAQTVFILKAIYMFGIVGMACGIYFLATLVLGSDEAVKFSSLVREKIKKKVRL